MDDVTEMWKSANLPVPQPTSTRSINPDVFISCDLHLSFTLFFRSFSKPDQWSAISASLELRQ